MPKLKGGFNGHDYKAQLIFMLVFFISLHALLDVLVWTNQIKFVGSDAKNILGILLTIIVAVLLVYLSYVILQNENNSAVLTQLY
jgi:hypothetical protein